MKGMTTKKRIKKYYKIIFNANLSVLWGFNFFPSVDEYIFFAFFDKVNQLERCEDEKNFSEYSVDYVKWLRFK